MYVPSLISIPFVLSKIWPRQATIMNNTRWLRGDNSCQYTGCDYGSCTQYFLLLLSIYKPIFISIPLVLLKIWSGQASLWKSKLLRGDYFVNIQSRILVIVHCPFSHCHLSINQVSFQSLLYFQRYGLDRHPLWKING